MVQILYTDISSCVTNNGWNSDYFHLERGVRQGCPLSPYLFIIAVELLAINIRLNPTIKGIKIGEKIYKIKQFADDTQLVILFDAKSMEEIDKVFGNFSGISGLTINYGKTEILRIGAIRNSQVELATRHNFKWTEGGIIVLGINIVNDPALLIKTNVEPIITKINNLIKIWAKRRLTLYGKVSVINTLLASQLIYRLSVLPSPNQTIIKSIDRILFSYLWGNKPHRIAKNVIIGNRQKAGIKMISIEHKHTSIKIAWVKRILDMPEICPILNIHSKIKMKDLLKCNVSIGDLDKCFKKCIPQFWMDVLTCWCSFNHMKPSEVKVPENELIWFNSNIKVAKRVLFYKDLYEKNVIQIKDLLNSSKQFYSFVEFQNTYNSNLNFVQYFGMIQAIPREYKQHLGEKHDKIMFKIDEIASKEKVSQYVYGELICKQCIFPEKAYQKLCANVNIVVPKETFLEAFDIAHKSTLSTKLRDFQFRLLHNIVVTNLDLKKWGIKQSDKCTFCSDHTETITHLLIECKFSQEIWNHVYSQICKCSKVYIKLQKCEVFMGLYDKPFAVFYNHICMVIKQYIYACRCLEKIPNKQVVIEKIKDAKHVEYQLAKQNDRTTAFFKKWELVENL